MSLNNIKPSLRQLSIASKRFCGMTPSVILEQLYIAPSNYLEFISRQASLAPTHVLTTPQPSIIRQSRELNPNSPWLNLSHHDNAPTMVVLMRDLPWVKILFKDARQKVIANNIKVMPLVQSIFFKDLMDKGS